MARAAPKQETKIIVVKEMSCVRHVDAKETKKRPLSESSNWRVKKKPGVQWKKAPGG